MGAATALFIAVFLACAVEAVEATTIVLAAGTARDWRSAGLRRGRGAGVLAVIVAVLGPAVSDIPLRGLRAVVGALLLVFGLQWIRKAILRASGHKALHDEDELYAKHLAEADEPAGPAQRDRAGLVRLHALVQGRAARGPGGRVHRADLRQQRPQCRDWPQSPRPARSRWWRPLGFAVKAPLARVPENTMKFVVGIMLTSFGVFWGAEGAGAHWPGSDAALLVIIPAIALYALGLVALLRRTAETGTGQPGRTCRPTGQGVH